MAVPQRVGRDGAGARGFCDGMGRCGAAAGGLADGIPLEAVAGLLVLGLSAVAPGAAGAPGTEAAGAEASRSW